MEESDLTVYDICGSYETQEFYLFRWDCICILNVFWIRVKGICLPGEDIKINSVYVELRLCLLTDIQREIVLMKVTNSFLRTSFSTGEQNLEVKRSFA